MLRISRLTDYAFIILTRLAEEGQGEIVSCSSLADQGPLPLPTVRKVCKKLAQEDLLVSHQGAHGGYELAHPPGEITVAQVIAAMEGPIALTVCSEGAGECEIEHACPVGDNWRVINGAIRRTLSNLTLADLSSQLTPETLAVATDGELPDPTAANAAASTTASQGGR